MTSVVILTKKSTKLLSITLLIINFASCQNQKKQSNLETVKIFKNDLNLEGHTFFKVIETDSGKILFKPCDASIEKYKFYKDSLYHNWGQELDIVKKISFKKNKNIYSIEGFNTNTNENNIFQIEKSSEAYYLKINDEIFIDSLQSKKIRLIEQPLKDCGDEEEIEDSSYTKKDIIFNTVNHVKKIQFSYDCNSNNYIYFLVGGQFVTAKLSMNTKLETISNTEFNIYFSKPLIDPINKEFNDSANYSELIPIAKANHIKDKLEFTWFGFYNIKTKKRVHEENPFTNKKSSESIILTKCD